MTTPPTPLISGPEEAVIDMIFSAVDGAIPIYFQEHDLITVRRAAISSGCARYTLNVTDQPVGILIVRSVHLSLTKEMKDLDPEFFEGIIYGEQTHLAISPTNTSSENVERTYRFLVAELWKFISWLHNERTRRLPLIHRATLKRFTGSLPVSEEPPPVSVSKKRGARPGPKGDATNIWAREEAAKGKTISQILPEYARRRKMDPIDARDLLRKALQTKEAKRKKRPD